MIRQRLAIRNLRICSKILRLRSSSNCLVKNSVDKRKKHFLRGACNAYGVMTATITHSHERTAPLHVNDVAPYQRSRWLTVSDNAGAIPTLALRCGSVIDMGDSVCESRRLRRLFPSPSVSAKRKSNQKQRTSASACARRRSSTAVLACSVDRNCPPRFPGTCAILSTVSAAT